MMMKWIFIAERHSILLSYIIPALEDLVRRPEPFNETEVVKLSGQMVAHIGVARETWRYVLESSKKLASEIWLKRAAHDFLKSIWYSEESSAGACAGSEASGAKILASPWVTLSRPNGPWILEADKSFL